MNKINILLGWMVELAILLALFWKCLGLSNLAISIRILLSIVVSSPIVACFLLNLFKKSDITLKTRSKMYYISGLSLVLCLFLMVNISIELKKYSIVGGATKEMVEIAKEKQVPHEYFQQWTNDTVERMKSERLLFGILLLSIGLILNKNSLDSKIEQDWDSHLFKKGGRVGV